MPKKHTIILLVCVLLPTRVQQIGIFISQNLVGHKVVPVPVERQEGHHVVAVVVSDGGVGSGVVGARGCVGPQPALKDTAGKTRRRRRRILM